MSSTEATAFDVIVIGGGHAVRKVGRHLPHADIAATGDGRGQAADV